MVKFQTISDYMTLDESKMGTLVKGKSYLLQEINQPGEGNWLNRLWDGTIFEWNLLGFSTNIEIGGPHPTAGYEQSSITLFVHASRKSMFYVWKAILPLSFLIILASAVFSFDVGDIADRTGAVSTYFLACFAMLFVVGDA